MSRFVVSHPVDAVLLDAGGVLLLPDPSAARRLLGPLGAAPDDEACARAHYLTTRVVDDLGVADWVAADLAYARAVGVPEGRLDEVVPLLDRLYTHEDWVPVPGAAEAVVALQAGGYRVAVVSNAQGTMEAQLLAHEICDASVPVVDSHVVGIEKPDPRIFAIALEALAVDPGRCVYVGDTVLFDVDGARAAGIEPVHVDPYGLCPQEDHEHAASLAAFVSTLARLP